MPVLETKYDHTKIYRPNGTRYARITRSARRHADVSRALGEMYAQAISDFKEEFQETPDPENIVIEVVVDSFKVLMDVFEIKQDV